jgi:replication-associated recombination protein RarA
METMPERLRGRRYYVPSLMGREADIKKRLEWWAETKEKIRREKAGKKRAE